MEGTPFHTHNNGGKFKLHLSIPIYKRNRYNYKWRFLELVPSEKFHHWAMEEPARRDSRIIPNTTKNLLAQSLLQSSQAGEVPYGAIEKAAKQFGVSRKTVHRIWAEAKLQIQRVYMYT